MGRIVMSAPHYYFYACNKRVESHQNPTQRILHAHTPFARRLQCAASFHMLVTRIEITAFESHRLGPIATFPGYKMRLNGISERHLGS